MVLCLLELSHYIGLLKTIKYQHIQSSHSPRMNFTQIQHYFLNDFGFWEISKTVVIVASCLPNLVLAFKILARRSTQTLFNIRKV